MSSRERTCSFCGKPPLKDEAGNYIKMKRCTRCRSVFYHDIECQKKHWKVHKEECGNPCPPAPQSSSAPVSTTRRPATSNRTKQKHRSMDPVHQLVTRRFKKLRSQGVSEKEAMKRARNEFQRSEEYDLDPGSKGGFVSPFVSIYNSHLSRIFWYEKD
jgi:hypothetical protein